MPVCLNHTHFSLALPPKVVRPKPRVSCSNSVSFRILQVQYIADTMSRPGYVPRNPTADDLPNVFDTRFPTVQPYLHRVCEVMNRTSNYDKILKRPRNFQRAGHTTDHFLISSMGIQENLHFRFYQELT